MSKKQKTISIWLTALLGVNIILLIFSGRLIGKKVSEREDFPQQYRIVNPPLPSQIYFAGDRVPLELQDIRERLDKEVIINTYLHSSTLLNIKRAARWFPAIERILKENGIPEDFKYIAIIESGLENLISSKKATGFWQFTEDAALQFGLEVNSEVDERYNAEKSTEAACRYLKQAYSKFKNWTMAAASYNMGMAGLYRQTERQKTNNYFDLYLNDETSRYIFRALALKTILTEPQKYGYLLDKEDLYKVYNTYDFKVESSISDLAAFAFARGINYKTLKILNPWLRDNVLTNKSGRTYVIKLPVQNN
ncbi:MAG: lytic transglycosylase domain-containing protein [Bacteroidota bacterium]